MKPSIQCNERAARFLRSRFAQWLRLPQTDYSFRAASVANGGPLLRSPILRFRDQPGYFKNEARHSFAGEIHCSP